jgi:hypothetical protein
MDLAAVSISMHPDVDQVPAPWRLVIVSTHQDRSCAGAE